MSLISIIRSDRVNIAITCFAVFLGFGVVGNIDYESAKVEQAHYCAMTELYHSTNGQAGWPAYNGREMCVVKSNEGVANEQH